MIRDKEITSTKVVEAYIERQKEVNPYINAVVQENYKKALKAAKMIDEYLVNIYPGSKEYEDLVRNKPLLGIPFSVKDSVKCEEFIPIVGIVARVKGENLKDKIVCKGIERWKEAGGIVLCSTNVPELCMWSECNNKVWGRTKNPYDTRRSAGGSSGGEGAIIGAGGSLFGVGSDIGGSIRIPSGHCGIFGYKHTPKAISTVGHLPEPTEEIMNLVGQSPMARYASDLKFVTRIFMSDEERELLKFDKEVDFNNLNFYYIEDFDFLEAEPISYDCRQGVRNVVKILEEMNKLPLNLYMDEFKYSFNLWQATLQLYTNDQVTGFDVYLTNFDKNKKVCYLWEAIKHLSGIGSDHDFAVMLFLYELKNIRFLNPELKKAYLDIREKLSTKINKILGENGILILPAYPTVAPPHNQQVFARMDLIYTAVFNALGFPVIVCPLYLNSEDIPISIQIVAGKNQDRLLFKFAEIIENKFGGWKEPR
uniref:Amidase domain-containing protein n=1 Tax=Parastrongyloides trichosuri TaxID=131310 RepID=A0A0N4Z7L8_PARTI